MPKSQLREAIRLNEVRKVQAKELTATIQKGSIQDSIIRNQEQQLGNYQKQTGSLQQQLELCELRVTYAKEAKELAQKEIVQLNADITGLERRNSFNKILFGGLALLAGFFYLTK